MALGGRLAGEIGGPDAALALAGGPDVALAAATSSAGTAGNSVATACGGSGTVGNGSGAFTASTTDSTGTDSDSGTGSEGGGGGAGSGTAGVVARATTLGGRGSVTTGGGGGGGGTGTIQRTVLLVTGAGSARASSPGVSAVDASLDDGWGVGRAPISLVEGDESPGQNDRPPPRVSQWPIATISVKTTNTRSDGAARVAAS